MYTDFGKYLRSIREGYHWTRVQASMKINDICQKRETIASVDALDKWERGINLPMIEATMAMSIAYKKPDLVLRRLEAIELEKKNPPVREHRRITVRSNILLPSV